MNLTPTSNGVNSLTVTQFSMNFGHNVHWYVIYMLGWFPRKMTVGTTSVWPAEHAYRGNIAKENDCSVFNETYQNSIGNQDKVPCHFSWHQDLGKSFIWIQSRRKSNDDNLSFVHRIDTKLEHNTPRYVIHLWVRFSRHLDIGGMPVQQYGIRCAKAYTWLCLEISVSLTNQHQQCHQ
jgi:hypothetical protein